MKYKAFKDIRLSTLGMGCMRLPSSDMTDLHAPINHEEAHKLLHLAYENGINYFDTAPLYNKGDSEKCLGEALKKYPRDSYYLASKYNISLQPDFRAAFEEQLERLGTDRIDFYLLHSLNKPRSRQYIESGCIDYFMEMKEKGRITYLGFSSHADPATLKMFADYHDWDFAQLQLNHFDWFFGTAKEEYDILAQRNIPIMVMEPVRGGKLADLTPDGNSILKAAHPDWSIPQWALRFVKSLPAVQVILSGMNTEEQLKDNLSTFDDDKGLSDLEMAELKKACTIFKSYMHIPCTTCRYCCEGCPMEINIPDFLNLLNAHKVRPAISPPLSLSSVNSKGMPADCIACGACQELCPQNIDIPDALSRLADLIERQDGIVSGHAP